MSTPSSRRPQPDPLRSAQLLVELVQHTLDPGYAAAARRRSGSGRRWYDRPLTAVGAVLVGLVLVVAYDHTNRSAPEAQRLHDRLVERVRTAQSAADDLEARLERTQRQLQAQQRTALPSGGVLARSLGSARLAAGAVAVSGPGLRVTLGDPPAPSASSDDPDRVGSVPITATHVLTDRDVRTVVNELWHDGAEAIAVNGIRLTPTSAIRFAGEAVLVDFRPITSPYRIEAIGDADGLATGFAQSAAASRYQTLKGANGIRFDFGNESHLDLPAAAAVTPRYASEAPSAPSAPSASSTPSGPSGTPTGPSGTPTGTRTRSGSR